MGKKFVGVAILMAMVFSIFGTVSASDAQSAWTTVFEDDFEGDLGKWVSVSDGVKTTNGAVDFNGLNFGMLNLDYGKYSDSVSIEFDLLKASSGLNIRVSDTSKEVCLISFKGYYDANCCDVWDFKDNYNQFGLSVLPDQSATIKYVINSDGIAMYKKAVGESDDAYVMYGQAYDDTALDLFKENSDLKISAIYYQSALSQPEDKTFNVGNEQVTKTVYPVVIDNVKIKNVKYGTPNFTKIFSDDFSSGNLDKWMGKTSLFAVVDDAVGINAFDANLIPKGFAPSKNFMLQFDAKGWMENIYVQFTDNADVANTFRAIMHKNDMNEWAQLWDLGNVWVNYASGCGIDGGTVDAPKTNSVRYILNDGVLSLYVKKDGDSDFVFKGSHSYEANDGVISNTAYYVPEFYVIGSQDIANVADVCIDNVVIKTIPENSVNLGAEKLECNFDTEDSLNDWDIPAFHFDGTEFKTDRPSYTWYENGSVYIYPWGGVASPINNITADELTVNLTLDSTNAVNQAYYMQLTNAADATDFVRIRISDSSAVITDGTDEILIPGVYINDEHEHGYKTINYVLESDKLTISIDGFAGQAVLDGDNFKKYVTENAEYNAGIYTTLFSNRAPINLDSFKVTSAPTAKVNAKLMTEVAKGSYALTAMPAADEKCRVELSVDEKVSGCFNGKLIAALYDGNKLVDVKTTVDINAAFDFAVPQTATKPVIKVMAWNELENLAPMGEKIVFAAE